MVFTQLPSQPNALFGRAAELAAARDRMMQPNVRMLTLLGQGGMGKTRLAVELAQQLCDNFPEGCAFVDLTTIREADEVVTAIGTAIGGDHIGVAQLPEMSGTADVVYRLLEKRRILLLLDNFEHLLHAAPTIAQLLTATRYVKCLVTSRVPLRLRWEHRFTVGPLGVPHPEAPLSPARLERSPAAQLFVERARAVDHTFDLNRDNCAAVAAICRRLQGVPLAIELAAQQIDRMPVHALLEHLDRPLAVLDDGPRDAPSRHQIMRVQTQTVDDGLIGHKLFVALPECLETPRFASVDSVPPELFPEALTPRELEVARLAARGLSNRQISRSLVISEATVAVHIKHILAKLNLRSRVQIPPARARRASPTL